MQQAESGERQCFDNKEDNNTHDKIDGPCFKIKSMARCVVCDTSCTASQDAKKKAAPWTSYLANPSYLPLWMSRMRVLAMQAGRAANVLARA